MNKKTFPKLYLAPMEGVATWFFRKAIAIIGGFDECCTEFIRVPTNAVCKSLAKVYQADLTNPIPQAAQIMGSHPQLMAEMTHHLVARQAPRIDLNCGCPSNVVTGKGAGSSLLKTPDLIYQILTHMNQNQTVPITAKVRAGFEDSSLFEENILAVQESKAAFITIHPRTKVQGYSGKADWTLIARAKQLLTIPVVGNGDIQTSDDALAMLNQTGCDHLMIGRGALKNPWIFHEIKQKLGLPYQDYSFSKTTHYIETFFHLIPNSTSESGKISLLKQLFSYLFWKDPWILTLRKQMLQTAYASAEDFLKMNLPHLKTIFEENTLNRYTDN